MKGHLTFLRFSISPKAKHTIVTTIDDFRFILNLLNIKYIYIYI